jgi:hypothetical protein
MLYLVFMRTELLILIDTIIKTPFDLINQIKMCDLWINKIFIGVINFYVKILDASKNILLCLKLTPELNNFIIQCFNFLK